MAGFTTRRALRHLLYDDDMLLRWMQSGFTKDDRSRYRHRLEFDKLTLDKMEELLEKCGYTVAQEKEWIKPTSHDN